jgi:hypothetical protein
MKELISRQLLIAAILSILISGCNKEFNYYQTEQKPVINCLFNPEDTLYLNISKTLNVFKSDSIKYVHGAQLSIYSKDSLINVLCEDTSIEINQYSGFYKSSGLIFKNNIDYILKGTVDKQKIYAGDRVPEKIDISDIKYSFSQTDQGYNSKLKLFATIKFDDPLGKNFYALSIDYFEITGEIKTLKNIFVISCSSPSIEATFEHVNFTQKIFSDKLFDGKTYSISFSIEVPNFMTYEKVFNIKLLSLSENYYKYAISYYKQVISEKDFYAEPSAIYSNVEGGLGIFAAYTKSEKQIFYK